MKIFKGNNLQEIETEKDKTVQIKTIQEITTRIEIKIEGTVETTTEIKVEMTAERDRHRDRSNLINEGDRRKNQQRSGKS